MTTSPTPSADAFSDDAKLEHECYQVREQMRDHATPALVLYRFAKGLLARRPTAAVPRSVVEEEQFKSEIIQEFLQRLHEHLDAKGIDFSDCDGDESEEVILAGWIAGQIRNAKEEALAPYLSQPSTEERTSEQICAQKETRPPNDSTKKLQGSNVNTRTSPGASNAPSDVPSGVGADITFHNPDNLPSAGEPPWRFLMVGEEAKNGDYAWEGANWFTVRGKLGTETDSSWTYRTQRPLPAAPQPTATEETK